MQLNTTDLTLADTSEAGRHNLMLMIQHMLERNPDQTLSEAMTKAIVWLQENEKENFETPRLRANRTSWK